MGDEQRVAEGEGMLTQTVWNADDGLTGLEGAIILVAFVTIASVFSFTILGSGFFATGTAQDVVYTGVDRTASSLMLIGDVYGYKASGRDAVDMLRFTIGPSVGGGEAMDLSRSTVTYATSENIFTLRANTTLVSGMPPLPGNWTIYGVSIPGDTDSAIIRGHEQMTIMVRMPESEEALPGEQFAVTLVPPSGTAVTVIRTIPSRINDVMVLV